MHCKCIELPAGRITECVYTDDDGWTRAARLPGWLTIWQAHEMIKRLRATARKN